MNIRTYLYCVCFDSPAGKNLLNKPFQPYTCSTHLDSDARKGSGPNAAVIGVESDSPIEQYRPIVETVAVTVKGNNTYVYWWFSPIVLSVLELQGCVQVP